MTNDFLMHPLAESTDADVVESPWRLASIWSNVAAGRVPEGDVQEAIQQCMAAAEYTKPGAGLMALGLASRASNDDGVLMQLIGLVAEGLLCRKDQIAEQDSDRR